MNYFKNYKVLIWILVALVILNLSAIATILYYVYYDEKELATAGPEQETPLFLKERMRLNEIQWQEYRRLHVEFRQESRELFDAMHLIRNEMLEEIAKEKPNEDRLYELAAEYGEKHAELKKATIHHFLKMKGNITPEQEQMMNVFLRNMMQFDRPGFGPGRGQGERQRLRKHRPWQN